MICSDSGRGQGSFPSWGRRRRRSVNDTETLIATESQTDEAIEVLQAVESKSNPLLAHISPAAEQLVPSDSNSSKEKPVEDPEEVHELLRVYSSRSQIPKAQALHAGSELDEEDQRPEDDAEAETTELKSKQSKSIESDVNRFGALFETAPKHLQQSGQQLNLQPMIGSVCVTATHYYSLLTGLLLFLLLFLLMLGSFTLVFRQGARHKLRSLESIPSQLSTRNSCADSSTDHSPHHSLRSDIRLHLPFHKPNRTGNFRLGHESLYSPPPQSEKSRSLRSLTVEQLT